jgi:hypothetical protein
LLSAENYEVAYQAQPCDAFQDPIYNMRAGRQHNFEQSKAEHAISPVSHITFNGVKVQMLETVILVQGIPHKLGNTIEEEDRGYKIDERGNEEEINRPSIANINRHHGQMGVR